MRRYFLTALLSLILLSGAAHAQDASFSELTPKNVDSVAPMMRLGADFENALMWSPDGDLLAVAALVKGERVVTVYRPGESDQPMTTLPGVDLLRPYWESAGTLVTDARYNPISGERLGDRINVSPSGRYLTSGERFTTSDVEFVDQQTGDVVTLETGVALNYGRITFSPDDRFVVLQLNVPLPDPSWIQVWDVERARKIAEVEYGIDGRIFEFASMLHFTPNGELLVVGMSIAATPPVVEGVILVNLVSGDVSERFTTPGERPSTLAISPDGGTIAFNDGLGVAVWTQDDPDEPSDYVETQHLRRRLTLPMFSPDMTRFAAVSDDRNVEVFRFANGNANRSPAYVIPGDEQIERLLITPDSSYIITFQEDDSLDVWRLSDGEHVSEVSQHCYRPALTVSGTRLVSRCFEDDTFQFHDLLTGELVGTLPGLPYESPDGESVAYWQDGVIEILSASDFEPAQTLTVITDYRGSAWAFDPVYGRAVFVGTNTRCLGFFDDEPTCEMPFRFGTAGVSFSENGERLLIETYPGEVSEAGIVGVWNTDEIGDPVFYTDNPVPGSYALDRSGETLHRFVGDMLRSEYEHFTLDETAFGDHIPRTAPGMIEATAQSPSDRIFMKAIARSYVTYGDENTAEIMFNMDPSMFPVYSQFATFRTDYGEGLRITDMEFSADGTYLAVELMINSLTPDELEETTIGRTLLLFMREVRAEPMLRVNLDVSSNDDLPNVQYATFSPDKSMVAGFNFTPFAEDASFGIWSTEPIENGREIRDYPLASAPLGFIPYGFVFSPNSSLIAAMGANEVKLWTIDDLTNGSTEPVATLSAAGTRGISFSPDGTLFYLWDSEGVTAYGIPAE